MNNNYSIYGINNSFNLLSNNKNFLINKIFIDKNSKVQSNTKLMNIIELQKNCVEYIDHNSFQKKYNYKHSQGIVIEFTGNLYSDLYSLDISEENICFIIADQLSDPQNLGQILRTCECAGINGIILPKHNSIHLTNSVLQVSQGAFMYINVFIETNLKSSMNYLKSKGFWIIGVENGIESDQWYNMDYKGKIAIVIGSEGTGIRRLIKDSCDFLTTIDMKGKINSLNVTAAVSTILFERQRQLSN